MHDRFENLIHVRCLAHILNISVKSGLKEKEIDEFIEKIRYFCKKIHCSSKLKSELKNQIEINQEPEISVVLDVETRWNSTFSMLSTALSIKKSITNISQVLKNENNCIFEELNEKDWANGSLIIKLLEPFYQSLYFQIKINNYL